MKVIVHESQTLQDLSLQYLGSAESVFEICKINNMAIDNVLECGAEIELPSKPYDMFVARFYKNEGAVPACAAPTTTRQITTNNNICVATNNDINIINNGNY